MTLTSSPNHLLATSGFQNPNSHDCTCTLLQKKMCGNHDFLHSTLTERVQHNTRTMRKGGEEEEEMDGWRRLSVCVCAYAVLHRLPNNPLWCGSKKQRKEGFHWEREREREQTHDKYALDQKQYAQLHLMNGIAGIFQPIPCRRCERIPPQHRCLTQHLLNRHASVSQP